MLGVSGGVKLLLNDLKVVALGVQWDLQVFGGSEGLPTPCLFFPLYADSFGTVHETDPFLQLLSRYHCWRSYRHALRSAIT